MTVPAKKRVMCVIKGNCFSYLQDVLKFGFSTREYVLLHENSKMAEQDDDEQNISKST